VCVLAPKAKLNRYKFSASAYSVTSELSPSRRRRRIGDESEMPECPETSYLAVTNRSSTLRVICCAPAVTADVSELHATTLKARFD
jgi:hypothetical protein